MGEINEHEVKQMNDTALRAVETPPRTTIVGAITAPLIGLTRQEVKLKWNPLLNTGDFFLTDSGDFMAVRDFRNGELIRATFKGNHCVDQTLTTNEAMHYDCLAAIRGLGFRYINSLRRWERPNAAYVWRCELNGDDAFVFMCRRLLKKDTFRHFNTNLTIQ